MPAFLGCDPQSRGVDKRSDEQRYKNHGDALGGFRKSAGQTAETEERRHHGEQEKRYNPIKYFILLGSWPVRLNQVDILASFKALRRVDSPGRRLFDRQNCKIIESGG